MSSTPHPHNNNNSHLNTPFYTSNNFKPIFSPLTTDQEKSLNILILKQLDILACNSEDLTFEAACTALSHHTYSTLAKVFPVWIKSKLRSNGPALQYLNMINGTEQGRVNKRKTSRPRRCVQDQDEEDGRTTAPASPEKRGRGRPKKSEPLLDKSGAKMKEIAGETKPGDSKEKLGEKVFTAEDAPQEMETSSQSLSVNDALAQLKTEPGVKSKASSPDLHRASSLPESLLLSGPSSGKTHSLPHSPERLSSAEDTHSDPELSPTDPLYLVGTSAKQGQTPKRGRGRPSFLPKFFGPKRQRGRPRTRSLEPSIGPKRPRGRPRLIKTEDSAKVPKVEQPADVTKRKPGRPRKFPQLPVLTGPRRPRGRPKKDITPCNSFHSSSSLKPPHSKQTALCKVKIEPVEAMQVDDSLALHSNAKVMENTKLPKNSVPSPKQRTSQSKMAAQLPRRSRGRPSLFCTPPQIPAEDQEELPCSDPEVANLLSMINDE